MNREPDWDLYRTFSAVLREGSLSGAARTLDMSQPSVSRHIEALERAIGAKLFVRSHRGLSPTERAKRLRPYAEALVATSAALLRTATTDEGRVAGTVRITAAEVIAVEHLPPILAAARRRHRDLAIELVASDTVSDLLQRQADIAVRMIEPVQQSLVARRVASVTLGLFAHRDYLAQCPPPKRLADLSEHDLIGVDSDAVSTRAIQRMLPGLTREDFALRTDSTLAQMAAIRSGFGVGVFQCGLAKRDPDLLRLLEADFSIELPVWIVMHEDLRNEARCRFVFDILADGISRSTSL